MLIEQLRKKENYSEIESDLAEIILNYGEEIAYISIRQLAQKAYTSTTTIQRFCEKTGCNGYRDFKLRYLKELSQYKANHKVDASRPFFFGAQPARIAEALTSLTEGALTACREILDYDALNMAADLIRSHRVILGYGYGDSGITMEAFLNRLQKLEKYCIFASKDSEDIVVSMNAGKESMGIFVSYSGSAPRYIRCARALKERGVPYIAVTSVKTPLADEAAVWLKVPASEMASDNIATFYSQECLSYILNLVYSIVYARNYEENHQKKKKIDLVTSSKRE